MTPAYCNPAVDEEIFAEADAAYAKLKSALLSDEKREQQEAVLERWLRVEQQELMRLLLTSHARLRGQESAVEPVVSRAPAIMMPWITLRALRLSRTRTTSAMASREPKATGSSAVVKMEGSPP